MTVAMGSRVDLFGVGIDSTSYGHATDRIMAAARERRSFGVSALAVHGLMEAKSSRELASKVDTLDLVTPDGQPVRWAMNLLHGADLADRVYGPDLTWHVIEAAQREGIGIFLFGSTEDICRRFKAEIQLHYPAAVVHFQPDRFRDPTPEEDASDIATINASGAGVVLVGRGCPRQEHWVADHLGQIHAAMLAVGAAFDYGAGALAAPPAWMQRYGLQWLFRLGQDPKRLWKRYLFTNSRFMFHLARAALRR